MSGTEKPTRLAAAAAIVLPMALAVLVGLPALDGTFVRDDWVYVPLNPLVAGEASVGEVLRSSFHPEHAIGLYRPLTTLSFLSNWRQAGETPRVYHATNLALAGIAAGLVAALLLAWGLGPMLAGLGAALYAAHPARSEAVLWIAARSELLMTVFALLALVAAQRLRGALRWPACALAAVAAAYSKEQGFVLVALVPLLPGLSRRERVAALATLLAALSAAFAWRWHVLGAPGPGGGMQVLPNATPLELAGFGLHHLGRYVRLLFWPAPLINEYDDPVPPVGWTWGVLGAAVALLGPVLLAARRPRAAFAVLSFVVPLVPVLNVVYRTGEIFAERFLCLPLAGFAALAALGAAALPRRFAAVAASALAAVVLVLAARFYDRARDWTSQRVLVEAGLRDAPDVGGSHHMVAADLLDEFGLNQPDPDDLARAGQYLVRALELSPQRSGAAMSLGKTRLRRAARAKDDDPARVRDLEEAARLFRAAIQASPDVAQARGALGVTLAYLGRLDEAEAMMREELSLHPREFRAALNLARILDDAKRPDEARTVREEALRATLQSAAEEPDRSSPLRAASQLAFDLGQKERALELVTQALAVAEDVEARAATAVELAALHVALGQEAEGRRVLEATRAEIEARPDGTTSRVLALATLDHALLENERGRRRIEAVLPSAHGLAERKLKAALAALR
jgi:tetratricopeptide (TPR) repeat protein